MISGYKSNLLLITPDTFVYSVGSVCFSGGSRTFLVVCNYLITSNRQLAIGPKKIVVWGKKEEKKKET